MKYLVFLFLSFSGIAQNINISVVSAERLNVVYRGIENPIKIAVPGAISFTATALGLKQVDSLGNYKLTPGFGKEVIVAIEAVMEDGSVLKEEKVFRIKGLPAPVATLYGNEGYVKLTKQEFIDAVVEIELEDFLVDLNFEVYGFTLYLPNNKIISVDGNRMSEEAIKAIKKVKNKKEIKIDSIRYIKNPNPTTEYRHIAPIIIQVNDNQD